MAKASRIPKKDLTGCNIFLLYGEDRYSIEEMVHKITDANVPIDLKDFNFDSFTEDNGTSDRISSAIHSYPVMAEKRVVVYEGIDKASADVLNLFTLFLNKKVESTVLILTAVKPDRRKPLFKQIAKLPNAVSYEFKPKSERELPQFIKNHAFSKNVDISDDAIMMISLNSSTDLKTVVSEIEKLIMYVDEKGKITEETVESVLGISKEYNFYKLQNAIAERKISTALKIANGLLGMKQNRMEPFVINLFLSRLITSAFMISSKATVSKMGIDSAARSLGFTNMWRDADVIQCAKNYSLSELKYAIRYSFEAELKLKDGYEKKAALFSLIEKIICQKPNKPFAYLQYFRTIKSF